MTRTSVWLSLSGFRDNQDEPLRIRYRRRNWTLRGRLVKYVDHPQLPPRISRNGVAWLLGQDGLAVT